MRLFLIFLFLFFPKLVLSEVFKPNVNLLPNEVISIQLKVKNKDKIKQLKTIVVLTVTFLISSKLTFVSSKYITFITY